MRSNKSKSQVRKLRKLKFWVARRGSSLSVPRLCVFRGNKHIQAQLIDDVSGKVLASACSFGKSSRPASETGTDAAKRVGATIGSLALSVGVSKVVFDRNGFVYHGRVASLADAARSAGLKF
jgi:large subunit ribosomal protein L18